jgi:catechol 2,3-dioxygenase-like lactoylglutathione lyase family enzyme
VARRKLPIGVRGIGWLGLVGHRLETRSFYSRILGLTVVSESPEYVYFRVAEDTYLELFAPAAPEARRLSATDPAVGFLVDRLEPAVARLEAAGVRTTSDIQEWSSSAEVHRWIYFEDPDGRVLLLLERLGDRLNT